MSGTNFVYYCSIERVIQVLNNYAQLMASLTIETGIALGFANDDNEWKMCLAEASLTSSAKQLRELFVLLLLNCAPTNLG